MAKGVRENEEKGKNRMKKWFRYRLEEYVRSSLYLNKNLDKLDSITNDNI